MIKFIKNYDVFNLIFTSNFEEKIYNLIKFYLDRRRHTPPNSHYRDWREFSIIAIKVDIIYNIISISIYKSILIQRRYSVNGEIGRK